MSSGYVAQRCLVEGCDRLEELANGRSAGGLCAGHRWRKKRGRPLGGPLDERRARRLSPSQLVREAIHAYMRAESDEEYDRAFATLMRRLRRYRHARRGRAPSER